MKAMIKILLLSISLSLCICDGVDTSTKGGIKSEVIFKYNVREEFGEYSEILSDKVKIKYNKNGIGEK